MLLMIRRAPAIVENGLTGLSVQAARWLAAAPHGHSARTGAYKILTKG